MPDSDSSIPTADFIFLREEIRHEDNLINQRISWLVSSQSFLLTAFAITLNGPLQYKFPNYERLAHDLISLIPVVGLLVCLLSCFTIFAGALQMRQVRRLAGAFHPPHLPGVQGTPLIRFLGLAGPILTPIIFLLVWLFLLIH